MKPQSLLSKVLIPALAVLVVNQMACSNASFQAADNTQAKRAPAPDNVGNPFNHFDTGDAVRCDNTNVSFCDPGDNGLTDQVPDLGWTPPQCDVSHSGVCYSNIYQDTRRNPISAVDIWLVVDSSRSFDSERQAVGRAVANSFIRNLVAQVPVNISVIASHAPSYPYYSAGGPTYRSAAPAMNPSVFYQHSYEPVTVTIRNTSEIYSKTSELLTKLDSAMRESPISLAKRDRAQIEVLPSYFRSWPLAGPHSGSDELGLRNFMDAMTGPYRASIPRDHGWVVLFMSDENDACVPFTNYSSRSPYKVGSYYYSHASDEAEMFDWYCGGVSVSQVYNQAMRFAGDRPFALGAMVYRDRNTIPSSAHAQADIGKGYLEVVARAGRQGVIVDLASASWSLENAAHNLVNELASITNESVGNHTQYPIYDNNYNRLSLNKVETINGTFNLQVYVDGQRSNYSIDPAYSLIRPSNIGRQVEIRFCLK